MQLMTRSAYGSSRGIARQVIYRQAAQLKITVHGPKKLVDPEEFDRARAQNLHPLRGGRRKKGILGPIGGRGASPSVQVEQTAIPHHLGVAVRVLRHLRSDGTEQAFAEVAREAGVEDDTAQYLARLYSFLVWAWLGRGTELDSFIRKQGDREFLADLTESEDGSAQL